MSEPSELSDLIDGYFAAWNERHASRRRGLIETVYAERARYVDPLGDATGWEAIDANVAAVQAQFPDHRFRIRSGIDAHSGGARFDWELVDGSDGQVAAGVDYVQLAGDGRLQQVTGFFGAVPEMAR